MVKIEGRRKYKFLTRPLETTRNHCQATNEQIDTAVRVANEAFEGRWRNVKPFERGQLLVELDNLFVKTLNILRSWKA